jgi:hypothetical protein
MSNEERTQPDLPANDEVGEESVFARIISWFARPESPADLPEDPEEALRHWRERLRSRPYY